MKEFLAGVAVLGVGAIAGSFVGMGLGARKMVRIQQEAQAVKQVEIEKEKTIGFVAMMEQHSV